LNIALSVAHCTQRGGGFTQAGASVRLGQEQMMMLPALYHTSLPPRLREAAPTLAARRDSAARQ